MNFVLAIHHPHDHHAIHFANAALTAGHEISLVFLYQEGVEAADRQRAGARSDPWRKFSRENEVPLAVCIGAAARRGLLDESAPEVSGRVRDGFEVVGLGQYIGALIEADRLVTFAADR